MKNKKEIVGGSSLTFGRILLFLILGLFFISLTSAVNWTENYNTGLLHYYKMNETLGNMIDSLGTSNWTANSINYEEDGILNTAYRTTLASITTTNFPTLSSYSFSFWINATYFNPGVSPFELFLWGTGSGFGFTNGGKFGVLVVGWETSTNPVPLNQWSNVIVTANTSGTSFYLNGALNGHAAGTYTTTATTVISDLTATYDLDAIIDEFMFYNRVLNTSEISYYYNGGDPPSFRKEDEDEDEEININLISPLNSSLISSAGTNFSVNYNLSNSNINWTNTTYYVWYENSTIFNKTIVSITGLNNDTSLFINNFVFGNYIWNDYACYGNVTFSNCSWSDNGNFTFTIGASEDAQYYNPFVHETEFTKFQLNITLLEGATIYDQKLYYNGTSFTGAISSLGSNKYSLNLGMSVPTINSGSPSELKNFLWSIIFKREDGTFFFQNFTEYQQNVSEISLTSCDSGNIALNFTNWNEENNTRLHNFDFYGTFDYWLGDGSVHKNLSVTNISINSTQFCLSNSSLEFYTNAQIQYEKEDFIKRSYYLINASLTNITNHIKLFSLASTASTSFIIDIVDQNQIPIPEVYLRIQRYYPGLGTFETIEMGLTDTGGSTIGHFEAETEDYKIIITSGNNILYESGVQKVFCRETPCTLTFQVGSTDLTKWNNFGNVSNLVWSLEFEEDSNIWTYSYIDLSGMATNGRLHVYKDGGIGKTTICNTNSSSTASTLTCNATGYKGTINAAAYITNGEEELVYLKSAIIGALKNIFGKEGLFLSALVLMVLAFAGLWNPAVGIILVVFGVIVMGFIGIASFGSVAIWSLILIALIILWEIKT